MNTLDFIRVLFGIFVVGTTIYSVGKWGYRGVLVGIIGVAGYVVAFTGR